VDVCRGLERRVPIPCTAGRPSASGWIFTVDRILAYIPHLPRTRPHAPPHLARRAVASDSSHRARTRAAKHTVYLSAVWADCAVPLRLPLGCATICDMLASLHRLPLRCALTLAPTLPRTTHLPTTHGVPPRCKLRYHHFCSAHAPRTARTAPLRWFPSPYSTLSLWERHWRTRTRMAFTATPMRPLRRPCLALRAWTIWFGAFPTPCPTTTLHHPTTAAVTSPAFC